MSDDEDWKGEPPEGRVSRDRARPGFWENQWQAGAAYALLGVTIIVAILIIVLRSLGWSEKMRRRAVILRPGGGIPYGIAITAGALIAMALQR